MAVTQACGNHKNRYTTVNFDSEFNMDKNICVYIDVDETFVRNYGNKRLPISAVIEHIKSLNKQGAILYCWSSGGSDYARASAAEFGIEDCFIDFLPKPEVVIDDLPFSKWRKLLDIHPNECPGNTIDSYKQSIFNRQVKNK